MDAEDRALVESNVEAYLAKYSAKELLRLVTVGSVDDGKSTLIGRLLHDTGMVYDDQLAAVRKASAIAGEDLDFSLLTDGLKAEREQGITIDVAYRYFSTSKRKFIIADTPGHVQYTRNMVTGASTADVALILIDARLGVLEQSRRHAFIASLLGIRHLAVCVNKMDLVGYDEGVFNRISAEFSAFAGPLGFGDVTFFPVSALKGTNIVEPSDKTPWNKSGTVLGYLESVPISSDANLTDFRFPVQYVLRPNLDYRGFAGTVASGVVKPGDEVVVLPSGKKTRVKAIDTYEGQHGSAASGDAVVIRITEEIDISRGDMLVHAGNMPRVGRSFRAHFVWMSETPLDREKTYIVKHTTQSVRAQIDEIHWKKDLTTLTEEPADTLALNDVALVSVNCHRALYVDAYRKNRGTGAFIVIDSLTNNTVGVGMIAEDSAARQSLDDAMREVRAGSALEPKTEVSPKERLERFGQRGATVWLTGLPGSGRWSLAYALERKLFDLGRTATVLDPTDEDLRSMISAARAATDAGLITICAFPSYSQTDRDAVRARIGVDRFVHVYVNTSPALCRERRPDAKFDGFEPPTRADITVALDQMTLDDAVTALVESLESRGQFKLGVR